MNVFEWLQHVVPADCPPLLQSLGFALIIVLVFDTYHLLFSAIFTWFKK